MKKVFAIIVPLLLMLQVVNAQQDPMFTKYMFNSLIFNPAYAGSREHLTMNLLHRTQWWGIDGAPNTQSLTIHSPLRNNRVGVGFSIVNDAIGPTNTLSANLSYAYRIPIGAKYKLSIGLQGGVNNWRADWTKLSIYDHNDVAYQETAPNYWLPNFGTGLLFYSNKFYVGAGCPRIIEYSIEKNNENLPIYARQYRHYYFMIGGAIPLRGDQLIFKPSALVKNVGFDSKLHKDVAFQNIGAPTEFNVDLSLFFYKTLWVGTSFRSSMEVFNRKSSYDSIDFWAAWYMENGLRIGAAYDYTITKLQQPAQGSFELMLGYEFDYHTKKVVTPRYFD